MWLNSTDIPRHVSLYKSDHNNYKHGKPQWKKILMAAKCKWRPFAVIKLFFFSTAVLSVVRVLCSPRETLLLRVHSPIFVTSTAALCQPFTSLVQVALRALWGVTEKQKRERTRNKANVCFYLPLLVYFTVNISQTFLSYYLHYFNIHTRHYKPVK